MIVTGTGYSRSSNHRDLASVLPFQKTPCLHSSFYSSLKSESHLTNGNSKTTHIEKHPCRSCLSSTHKMRPPLFIQYHNLPSFPLFLYPIPLLGPKHPTEEGKGIRFYVKVLHNDMYNNHRGRIHFSRGWCYCYYPQWWTVERGGFGCLSERREASNLVHSLPIVTPNQRARTLRRTVLSIRKKCNSQLSPHDGYDIWNLPNRAFSSLILDVDINKIVQKSWLTGLSRSMTKTPASCWCSKLSGE